MERYNLGDEMFRLVNVYLAENGLKVNRGTIVDATIINAVPDIYIRELRQK